MAEPTSTSRNDQGATLPTKRDYFDRVVADLNLDTRDPFTLLIANAFALADQRDGLAAELKRVVSETRRSDNDNGRRSLDEQAPVTTGSGRAPQGESANPMQVANPAAAHPSAFDKVDAPTPRSDARAFWGMTEGPLPAGTK